MGRVDKNPIGETGFERSCGFDCAGNSLVIQKEANCCQQVALKSIPQIAISIFCVGSGGCWFGVGIGKNFSPRKPSSLRKISSI